jgi:integrase
MNADPAEPFDAFRLTFETAIRARGLSPRTLSVYLFTFDLFAKWADERPVGEMTSNDINTWITSMGVSSATQAIRYRSLQQAWKFIVAETGIPNPMAGTQAPKVADDPPPFPTEAEIERLIAEAERTHRVVNTTSEIIATYPDHLRDTAMIRFFIDTGCRLGEVAALEIENLDLSQRRARVTGKTGTRTVSFSDDTAAALDRWLRLRKRNRRPDVIASPLVWIGHRGPMTYWGVYQTVDAISKRAGLDVNPHQLRHHRASWWLRNGGQQSHLQTEMGWRSPAMVARYAAHDANIRSNEESDRLFAQARAKKPGAR